MRRSILSGLAGLAAFVVAVGAPAGRAGAAGEPHPDASGPPAAVLEHLTDAGSAIRLGFGVSPLHWQGAPVATVLPGAQGGESVRPLDAEPGGTAVSFDLRLAWPGAARTARLEPYVALGPALFVIEPDAAGRLLGTRVDPVLQLGAKAGAGVNWRLGRHATVFGAYEVTTTGPGALGPAGAKASSDNRSGAYDFTYGLRFLY